MMDKEKLTDEEFERIYLHPMITSFDLTIQVSSDEFKTFYINVMEELRNNLRKQKNLPINKEVDDRFGLIASRHQTSKYSIFCMLFGITIRQRYFDPNHILRFGGYKKSKELTMYDSDKCGKFNNDAKFIIDFLHVNPMNLLFTSDGSNSLYRGVNEFNKNTKAFINLRKLFIHLGLKPDKYIPKHGNISCDCDVRNIRIDTNFQYKSRCDFYIHLNRLIAEKMGYSHPVLSGINDEKHAWVTTFHGFKYYPDPRYIFSTGAIVRMTIPSEMINRLVFNRIKLIYDKDYADSIISQYKASDIELYCESNHIIQISIVMPNIRMLYSYSDLDKVKSEGDLFRSLLFGKIDTYSILYEICVPMFGSPDATLISRFGECNNIDIFHAKSELIPIDYNLLPTHNHVRDYYFSKNVELVPILSKLPIVKRNKKYSQDISATFESSK